MRDEVAQKIVRESRRVYDRIAVKFASTRKHPWDDFRLFDQYVRRGDRVLDIGCGNGRLAQYLAEKNVDYTGIDSSEQLIAIARREHPEASLTVADATTVPFSADEFNVVFCIATLHHIPSAKLRRKVAEEAYRVLKPGGYLMLTGWNLWSKQWWGLLTKFAVKKLVGLSELDWGDVMKPWKNERGEIIGGRYLHPFTKCALAALLKKNGFEIKQHQYTKRGLKATALTGFNIVTIAQKA